MHQCIDRDFGSIGQLNGRGGRVIMVLFLSMQRDTPKVAKIEESPTATPSPFPGLRPPCNVNVGNKCIPLPFPQVQATIPKLCFTAITMDQLWAEALRFICRRHAHTLRSEVGGQGCNTAPAFVSAVMLTSTSPGLWCHPLICQGCHISMSRQNRNAARASKSLWSRFLFWGYSIALSFPTGLWCHPLTSRLARLFCYSLAASPGVIWFS